MKNIALFDKPEPARPELSRMYAAPDYRAGSDNPRWTAIKRRIPVDCDECFARQIETRGTSGPRNVAKVRRTIRGKGLNLCRSHEDLWRIRDTER